MTSVADRTRVPTSRLLLWSGTDEEDERAVRAELIGELTAGNDSPTERLVCRVGAVGEPSRPVRGAVVVASGCTPAEVAHAVAAAPARTVRPGGPRPVALLFPGQGSQHAGMATQLYRHQPTFRGVVDEVLGLWGSDAGAIRADWLDPDDPDVEIDDVRRAQPLLFAVDLALGRLLLSWGVAPADLLGHSAGEVVAATLAGVFSTAEAVALVRGRVHAATPIPAGGMIAVAAGVAELEPYLTVDVAVAAVNAARQTMLAGPVTELGAVADRLTVDGFTLRPVPATTPFHSPAMEPAVAAAERSLTASGRPPLLPVWSGYTGALLTPADAGSARFWARQIAETVYFGPALGALLAGGERLLVEAGPGRTLTSFALRQQAVRTGGSTVVPMLPGAGTPDDAAMLETAAALWAEGHDLDLDAVGGCTRPPLQSHSGSAAHSPGAHHGPRRTL